MESITPTIRPLLQEDDRDSFDCGRDSLNHWFKRNAWRNQKSGTSRTYIIYDEETNKIKGYITLAIGEIQRSLLSKRRQRNMPDPVPVILLAQLAVDVDYHGQGISKYLLSSAFHYAIQASKIAGGFALITHPIDTEIRSFYKHWGFEDLEADPRGAMYLRIRDLELSYT